MFETYIIIEFFEDGILAETSNKKIVKLTKIRLPTFAQKGDRIRHCEHHFYDVVDENGNLLFRNNETN